MKYLKLFENNGYEKIPVSEYESLIYGSLSDDDTASTDDIKNYVYNKWERFKSDELAEINKLSNFCEIGFTIGEMKQYDLGSIYLKKKFGPLPYICNIHKLSDEWYYIENGNKYYKCDQFDGLINCLKTEILNINI